jgi:hypothetical protein
MNGLRGATARGVANVQRNSTRPREAGGDVRRDHAARDIHCRAQGIFPFHLDDHSGPGGAQLEPDGGGPLCHLAALKAGRAPGFDFDRTVSRRRRVRRAPSICMRTIADRPPPPRMASPISAASANLRGIAAVTTPALTSTTEGKGFPSAVSTAMPGWAAANLNQTAAAPFATCARNLVRAPRVDCHRCRLQLVRGRCGGRRYTGRSDKDVNDP